MTSDSDDLSKVTKHTREAKEFNIAILPPDINESGKPFVPTDNGIRFAMGAIKGVGEGVVDAILAERSKKGHFLSLYDFICRIETKKVGKKVIECLIESGCFDFTGWDRQALLESVDPMFAQATKDQTQAAQGVRQPIFSIRRRKGNSLCRTAFH